MRRLDRLVLGCRLGDDHLPVRRSSTPRPASCACASAGHPPPLIRRADGAVERLEGALATRSA